MDPARLRGRHWAAEVAAEGTDPDALLDVVCWLVRPRGSPDALRRVCQQDAGDGRAPAERLRDAAGSPTDESLAAATRVLRRWEGLRVRAALLGDRAYPLRLASGWPDTDGPPLLAWRGSPPGDAPAVAFVGARRSTRYGTGVAAWLAEAVANAGVRVVSGGAVGIDAAAHLAALEAPGGTTVVLGCGHAVDYPREHAAPGGLFERVLGHGGTLVSEQLPFQRPLPAHVRARNRIVAGLADAVVVVEGGPRSGALITASAAADRGVQVLAVPGDVRAPGSVAPHRLLAEGAAPCTGPADLVSALAEAGAALEVGGDVTLADSRPGAATTRSLSLSADVHRILAEAWPRAVRVDELASVTGRPVPVLLAMLTRASLVGEVSEGSDGVCLRRSPGAG